MIKAGTQRHGKRRSIVSSVLIDFGLPIIARKLARWAREIAALASRRRESGLFGEAVSIAKDVPYRSARLSSHELRNRATLGWQLYCRPIPGAAVQLPHQREHWFA
jgi:hypothetical protein